MPGSLFFPDMPIQGYYIPRIDQIQRAKAPLKSPLLPEKTTVRSGMQTVVNGIPLLPAKAVDNPPFFC
jgi:hypothetical protein